MIEIRYVQSDDKKFWFGLDRHLPEREFEKKVRDQQGYVLLEDGKPVGLLRYNLFWDNTPFCTMLGCCGCLDAAGAAGVGVLLGAGALLEATGVTTEGVTALGTAL